MYAYYLEDEDLEYIELVIANGEPFILEGNAGQTERKEIRKPKRRRKSNKSRRELMLLVLPKHIKTRKDDGSHCMITIVASSLATINLVELMNVLIVTNS